MKKGFGIFYSFSEFICKETWYFYTGHNPHANYDETSKTAHVRYVISFSFLIRIYRVNYKAFFPS